MGMSLRPFATALFAAFFLSAALSLQAQQRLFPNTRDGIHVFYDQLPYNLNAAQLRFAATHFSGCQKMTLDLVRALRSHNPGFIVLNHHLAFGTHDNIEALLRTTVRTLRVPERAHGTGSFAQARPTLP
jgi:hypothetical protein